jgi:hypothetical protein
MTRDGEAPSEADRNDYDSPWKDLLQALFRPFMAFFFPDAEADVDWARAPEFLDKELQKVTRKAETGRGYVDKLVKVWRHDGQEAWVLVHVEVQTGRDSRFPKRMYIYNYRLFDRYERTVASLAVLADDDPGWRPAGFWSSLWGCRAGIDFPVVKLLDYAGQPEKPSAEPANPFEVVVQAHLAALATRQDPKARLGQKISVTRRLYRLGLDRQQILAVYAFIDWVMALPQGLEIDYHNAVASFEEEQKMRYVTTAERIGMEKGERIGKAEGERIGEARVLARQLEKRFGPLSEERRRQLELADAESLLEWSERILTAQTVDEVFH